MCAIRWETGGQWCLRLYGQSVGPGDGDLYTHPTGTHQPSVLITGRLLTTAGTHQPSVLITGRLLTIAGTYQASVLITSTGRLQIGNIPTGSAHRSYTNQVYSL
jgi:hypothetical protein